MWDIAVFQVLYRKSQSISKRLVNICGGRGIDSPIFCWGLCVSILVLTNFLLHLHLEQNLILKSSLWIINNHLIWENQKILIKSKLKKGEFLKVRSCSSILIKCEKPTLKDFTYPYTFFRETYVFIVFLWHKVNEYFR